MIHDPQDRRISRLSEEQINSLRPYGKVVDVADRAIIQQEGDQEYFVLIVL